VGWLVGPGGCLDEDLQPGYEVIRLTRRHPGKGPREQVKAEHLTVPAERAVSGRGQPDQRAPPVGRIALALEQPLVLQVADDLADDRLSSVQVPAASPIVSGPAMARCSSTARDAPWSWLRGPSRR
jgi:hypothetical protein